MEIKIKDKTIGKDHPCFLIAEAGINHNGDFFKACDMVEKAKEAGVDVIKFQSYITEDLVLPSEKSFSMLKKYELSAKLFFYLATYCNNKGIIFLSTPFDIKSAKNLASFVPAYKVSSGDMDNYPLLDYICSVGKPIFLSTGMSSEDDVRKSVYFIKEHGINNIVIFQCTTQYPVPDNDVNLNVVDLYNENFFDCIVGFSDHTVGNEASLGAVAKGAKVVERHFTLDKNMEGPDHKMSMNPEEMIEWVRTIRKLERQLGVCSKSPSIEEVKNKKTARKSIVSIQNIKKGDIFSKDNIFIKRPGFGISPRFFFNVLGKKSNRDILNNSIIWSKDIENFDKLKNK